MTEAFWQFVSKCLGNRSNLILWNRCSGEKRSSLRPEKAAYVIDSALALRQSSCPRAENPVGFFSLLSLMLVLAWETWASRGVEAYLSSQAEWDSAGAEAGRIKKIVAQTIFLCHWKNSKAVKNYVFVCRVIALFACDLCEALEIVSICQKSGSSLVWLIFSSCVLHAVRCQTPTPRSNSCQPNSVCVSNSPPLSGGEGAVDGLAELPPLSPVPSWCTVTNLLWLRK